MKYLNETLTFKYSTKIYSPILTTKYCSEHCKAIINNQERYIKAINHFHDPSKNVCSK